jgi:hypothetical protein
MDRRDAGRILVVDDIPENVNGVAVDPGHDDIELPGVASRRGDCAVTRTSSSSAAGATATTSRS